jgi:hypothetical protein
LLHRGAVHLADTNLAVEAAQREVDQQPAVFAARIGAHAVVPGAGVAIKPRKAEIMQRRTAPLRPSLAVVFELDRTGFGGHVGRRLRWRPSAR